MDAGFIVALVLALVVIVVIAKTAVVVPQQNAYIIESLGKYSRTLESGFALLIPFVERVAYRHSLKERAIDVEEQICITSDNVQVGVDGVLYLQVMDARKASYGIGNYLFAIAQLAQTTLRSEIGKIELDKTFEERSHINLRVVEELDQASNPWGVKVLRYEIKNINPPHDVLSAMEKQMRAEREKRATILESEGPRVTGTPRGRGRGGRDPGGRRGDRRGVEEGRRGAQRSRLRRAGTRPRARSSASSRSPKRPSSSRSTRPRARRPRSWRSPRRPPRG